MSRNISMFKEVNEYVNGNVVFGDDSKVPVNDRWDILFHVKDGSHQLISNIYYVPSMKSNILNSGQFLKKGYDFHSKDFSFFLKRW